ncbi:hypothetical protein BH18THE2_BH18THE2_36740 [soil metagenome]
MCDIKIQFKVTTSQLKNMVEIVFRDIKSLVSENQETVH